MEVCCIGVVVCFVVGFVVCFVVVVGIVVNLSWDIRCDSGIVLYVFWRMLVKYFL